MNTRRLLLLTFLGLGAALVMRSPRRAPARKRVAQDREDLRRWESEGGAVPATGTAVAEIHSPVEVGQAGGEARSSM